MRRAVAIGAVVLAAQGCLLFTDINGLDSEDALADAASNGDGGAVPEASDNGDVAVAADGGGLDGATGCKTSDAAFCVDFDDHTLAGHWTTSGTAVGTTIEISDAVSVSPSASLHSAIDRAKVEYPTGGCAYARPERNLVDLGGRSNGRFSFDVMLGAPTGPVVTDTELVASVITSDGCTFIVGLSSAECSAQLQTNSGTGGQQFQKPLPLPIGKSWAHVDLALDFGGSSPAWQLLVNGTSCGTTQIMPAECRGTPTLKVGPGLYCVPKGTGVVEAYFDNVEFR